MQKITQIEPPVQPPSILYHATYKAFVESILQKGLIPRYICVWEDCDYGVFLANDPREAQSYPETTDNTNIPDEYLNEIVVLQIDANSLDRNKLEPDPHLLDGTSTWIYRGTIPPSAISLIS